MGTSIKGIGGLNENTRYNRIDSSICEKGW